MKSPKKKIISLFILVFFVVMISFFSLSVLKTKAETKENEARYTEIPLQIQIPGITKKCVLKDYENNYCVKDFGEYMIFFYRYFVGIVGIFSTVMIIAGGLQWITAGGNEQKISSARSTISGAVIGLVLTLTSFVLLNTISPQLVKMKFPRFEAVGRLLQSKYLCRTNPAQTYSQALGKMVDSYDLKGDEKPNCGKSYQMNPAAGFQGDCMGDYCPGEEEICWEDKDHSMDCYDAEWACEHTDKNYCQETNAILALAQLYDNKPKLANTACSKMLQNLGSDSCIYGSALTCPKNSNLGYTERIACNTGIELAEKETKCWNKQDGARHKESRYCTDDPMTSSAKSICCASVYSDIRCAEDGKEGEILVNCAKAYWGSCDKKCWGTPGLTCKDSCSVLEIEINCDFMKNHYTVPCSKKCCIRTFLY